MEIRRFVYLWTGRYELHKNICYENDMVKSLNIPQSEDRQNHEVLTVTCSPKMRISEWTYFENILRYDTFTQRLIPITRITGMTLVSTGNM